MSLSRIRVGYAIGFAIGIFFIALGIYSLYYFLAVKQVMGNSTSPYGNYGVAGLFCIFFGAIIARMLYPVFITFIFPIKKNDFNPARVCPFCGAIAEENATICEKCKQQIDE